MKNKISLIVIFASFGFAIYAFFNNLEKAKTQMYYYEGTELSSVKSNNDTWKNKTSYQKKKYTEKNTLSDNSGSYSANLKTKQKQGLADSGISDLSFDKAGAGFSTKRKSEQGVASDMGTSGVLLAQSSYSLKSNNGADRNSNISGVSSQYPASSAQTGTYMGAPNGQTDTNGDIIVDPGGDPDPGSMIPVGEGQIVLLALAFVYLFFIRSKKTA